MDDMSSPATTPGPAPRPGLPAVYTDEGPATPTAEARPGLEPVTVGTGPLTIDEVVRVARDGAPVVLAEESLVEVRRTREVIRGLANDTEPHYGVSTGFGALATRHIPVAMRRQLQRSLVRSHAAGSGPEVEREVVRALMLLRISTLATGRTGIREETLTTYVALLNAGIAPVVHEYGSLGCSGDLAPLSHCALALMGEGVVRDAHGERMPAADALAVAGIRPVELEEKEGLALINGTDGMLGMLCLAIHDLRELLVVADVATAMSVEGLLGTDDVFAADLHALRPQPGQAVSAENIRKVMAHSADSRVAPHRGLHPRPGRLLDALRPGGRRRRARHRRPRRPGGRAGSSRPRSTTRSSRPTAGSRATATSTGRRWPTCSTSSRSSPLTWRRSRSGAPTGSSTSHAATDCRRSSPTTPASTAGHMIAQYTQAAIVSEMKRLAAPASVDSIPSSAMQEDHVSMGWSAARKLRRAVDGLSRVLAVEVLTAARGIQLRSPLAPAPATAAVVDALVTAGASRPGGDRWLSPEIDTALGLVLDGTVRRAAESETGPLT